VTFMFILGVSELDWNEIYPMDNFGATFNERKLFQSLWSNVGQVLCIL